VKFDFVGSSLTRVFITFSTAHPETCRNFYAELCRSPDSRTKTHQGKQGHLDFVGTPNLSSPPQHVWPMKIPSNSLFGDHKRQGLISRGRVSPDPTPHRFTTLAAGRFVGSSPET
jgi:hypothetical protein